MFTLGMKKYALYVSNTNKGVIDGMVMSVQKKLIQKVLYFI